MKSLAVLAALALCSTPMIAAQSIHDFKVKDIDGKETSLASTKGQVVLVVNVASKCGLTPQYKGLEALYQKYKDRGFTILGFPCNQFGNQEPGTNTEIKEFCTKEYGVTFPMFDKIEVNGANRHPLYTYLAGDASPTAGDIKWNFTKFLIGPDGKVVKRFEPRTTPEAAELTAAVEAALKANGK